MRKTKKSSATLSKSSRKADKCQPRRSAFATGLVASLTDAANFVRGDEHGCRTTEVRVPDVKSVREHQGMTQQQFSRTYHIPLATLKNWEQGRRDPDSTISAYMQVIAARPALVQKILSGQ